MRFLVDGRHIQAGFDTQRWSTLNEHQMTSAKRTSVLGLREAGVANDIHRQWLHVIPL
jgi:hypothetical protein